MRCDRFSNMEEMYIYFLIEIVFTAAPRYVENARLFLFENNYFVYG